MNLEWGLLQGDDDEGRTARGGWFWRSNAKPARRVRSGWLLKHTAFGLSSRCNSEDLQTTYTRRDRDKSIGDAVRQVIGSSLSVDII